MAGRVRHVLRTLIAVWYFIRSLARPRFSCTCGLPAARGAKRGADCPFLEVEPFLIIRRRTKPCGIHNVGRENRW
jgi:hypothetical protein